MKRSAFLKPQMVASVILALLLLIFSASFAAGFIIDHTCRDASQIPIEWINVVKTMTLHHTGQSHGIQVPYGMQNLENENPTYDQTQGEEGIPAGSGLKITRGQRNQYSNWESSIGVERYWQGVDGRAWTERTMDYHAGNSDTVHASLHTWCWHLRTWSESQVNEYLSSMEILETEYPNTTFIYMTDTCDYAGDFGYNRWLRNEQIRQYCRDNDKVLFDFGELESWSADGTEQNTYYHTASGQNIPFWHNDWSIGQSNDYGHINEAGTVMKAKAMWWLMARMAGWNPDGGPVANFSGTPTTGTVPLAVSFTDTSTGEITGWSWDFDNNGTEDSTDQNPTYTYNDAGTYSVTLEVTGPGGTDTETKTNYITVTAPIQYNLTVNIVGSGSVTLDPAGGTYNAGTEVELTPVPDTGWAFNGWSGALSGYSNPATIVMDTNKTITATFDVDGDADGISDEEEDAGPNGGDGNSDTIQDSDQANVATFHTQDGTNYVTLESAAGTTLAGCSAVSIPSAPGAPSGITFAYGFLNFTINGAGVGGATTLTLYLPAGANINTYWKYGSTPANTNPHWYEFMYESSTQTGAEINGNKIILHFIDGQRGDDDIISDGVIIDQGGPGTDSSISGGSSDDASGGGCFVRAAYGK
jgi:PKD repeat protein